ncbi:hypothetical protein MRB53_024597 [Persea americana]|uniref:Uncharacterized protein n=1 Tax=Persea americana TaxID=3435 RepID=A0ACC2LE20_PERAE|nr:hypothetical protein MRB53_024597 [Persea americana]
MSVSLRALVMQNRQAHVPSPGTSIVKTVRRSGPEGEQCEHSGIRYLNKRTLIEIPLIFDGNQGGVFSCCNSSLLERYVLPAWFTLPILSLVGSSA